MCRNLVVAGAVVLLALPIGVAAAFSSGGDGSLDASFGRDGVVLTRVESDAEFGALALQRGGKLVGRQHERGFRPRGVEE